MVQVVEPTSTPRFARGVKFRKDVVRDAWVVLAPERLFLPDEQAVEILQLADGQRSVAAIVELLAQRFAAPAEVISADVVAMLQDLTDKGVLEL
jgi:pyrroloquinoline quinone biosynthesis protein D